MNLLIIFAAKYLFLVSILVLLGFLFTLSSSIRKRFIYFTLLSFGLSFASAKLLALFFTDPRPFVSDHITPLIAHVADNGFPSDHTLLTMTIAAMVFYYNRKLGIVLGIISFVVGYARVLAGIHHSIDILGAMLIAIVAVSVAYILSKKVSLFHPRVSGKFE